MAENKELKSKEAWWKTKFIVTKRESTPQVEAGALGRVQSGHAQTELGCVREGKGKRKGTEGTRCSNQVIKGKKKKQGTKISGLYREAPLGVGLESSA